MNSTWWRFGIRSFWWINQSTFICLNQNTKVWTTWEHTVLIPLRKKSVSVFQRWMCSRGKCPNASQNQHTRTCEDAESIMLWIMWEGLSFVHVTKYTASRGKKLLWICWSYISSHLQESYSFGVDGSCRWSTYPSNRTSKLAKIAYEQQNGETITKPQPAQKTWASQKRNLGTVGRKGDKIPRRYGKKFEEDYKIPTKCM